MQLSECEFTIVGLGLMGASLALALRGKVKGLTGYDIDPATLEAAETFMDHVTPDLAAAVSRADVVVLAAPVRAIIDLIPRIGPSLKPGAFVTDLGSTKTQICAELARLPAGVFTIGGHPMCGKESSGYAAADPTMYQGCTFAVCDCGRATPDHKRLMEQLIHAVGGNPYWIAPVEHDRHVAIISHLPYLLSMGLVAQVDKHPARDALFNLASTGFKDTSRLAGSDLAMMGDVLATNTDAIWRALSGLQSQLSALLAAFSNEDPEDRAWLHEVRNRRREWGVAFQKRTEKKPVTDSLEIQPIDGPVDAAVRIPGSKSITNRALLLAALTDGPSTFENALFSEDSLCFMECLRRLGFSVEADADAARITVHGLNGHIPATSADLFVGNAGTAARFLTAAVCIGNGDYHFDGVPRMRERPIAPLLSALRRLGPVIDAEGGHFPLTVHTTGLSGGLTSLDASESSQYLSAMLMIAPYAASDVTIAIEGTLVSQPYIETTIQMMQQFGVTVERDGYQRFMIKAGQRYQARAYAIEPDASNASYFFAAAALTGGRVTVPYLTRDSLQGDIHFLDVLAQMGCTVTYGDDGVTVQGPAQLRGVEVDMNAISDTVQTLAAIAPFADGPVTVRNVQHIRHKETDRIQAVVTELRRLGITVDEFADGLKVYPGTPRAAAVDTYQDHRMAMAFAVTGLRTPGLRINDPGCTQKTFPDYFQRFGALYDGARVP
jgi:3-phosphoshikimate 1-carboxyvinyltransferase